MPNPPTPFPLRADFIPLDSLLKATGLAPSGAQAKQMVAEGLVQVDGAVELRKTAKMRAGQVVAVVTDDGVVATVQLVAGSA